MRSCPISLKQNSVLSLCVLYVVLRALAMVLCAARLFPAASTQVQWLPYSTTNPNFRVRSIQVSVPLVKAWKF